jgi:NDP-sugar pyrophosphorylase family protein
VLCVGHLGDMIEAEIGDGNDLGLRISYSFDGPNLLGTGGALKRALAKLGDHFVVIYGDSYMPVDYAAIVRAFVHSSKPALMTILKNDGRWDTSNVHFERGEILRYDKKLRTAEMRHIDYGIAVLSAAVFGSYPGDVAFDLADVYSRLVNDKQMAAYEVKQRFYEIGTPKGLTELDSLLRERAASISS